MSTAQKHIEANCLERLRLFCGYLDEFWNEGKITINNVDRVINILDESGELDILEDELSEFRCSGEPHYWEGSPDALYSRHYEYDLVIAKLEDGTWVGWLYYYGGGKHGDPGSIEWLEHAQILDVVSEKRVTTTVREFKAKA